MARHYAYRTTADKLNDAFERIDDDDGQVVQTIHLGGRDFVIVYRHVEPASGDVSVTYDPARFARGPAATVLGRDGK